MTASISFRDVTKTFPVREKAGSGRRTEFTAVQGVDLEVAAGEFTVLVGPSGCGKSTLLDLLGGLTQPSGGQILVDGEPVTGPGLDRGIVFQQYALLPWRTAQGNVEFGLEATGVPRRRRAERARHYLDLVGLAGFEDRHPHELSGGMKQRVAIARSLAYDPDVLLMDEPFAALDAQTRESLQDELLGIWERTGKTIVFITHGIEEAVYLGQRVAVLTSRPGRVKQVVPIDLGRRTDVADLRSSPEFAHYRHRIWDLLHDEVARAQELERAQRLEAADPVGRAQRIEKALQHDEALEKGTVRA
ncbi:ABC transporter ATP-binding protein [Wenjunlia tyrosinilytica]|uniref:ABC transporter ATP-binding protein n=1 Tax=Wenjunlia tyrosinilytica TaxID=1544741 RepID=A0A918DXW6_9ACTN|nr:ABC transporter ATP-binding protein [Wenjunlia tyrosinilytica]GGO87873.1 ABC transporter ATP-binding protein [Wenjunlia tyrosinilytica]